ncbi:hypothetical protein [Urbifossiella limnaea]|uniref:ParB/Sulfiredoxin domain-containing protein n=1 Tax=Urbifossiella limnaea TaxID=2528023 RepID=A0A517Y0L0_9BACT|nr:hypothetical protein [Urbifossiella limnaea]QDU23297.1 hypothetical protein ETAA1_52920 [Urbifossiella limnaea]
MAKKPAAPEAKQPYERVDTKDLFLDPTNPRLAEYSLGEEPTQADLLRVLWEKMAVDELAMSIASSGYFDHEPVFVATEGGKDIVIEGNRRLAAVKILLDDSLRKRLKIDDLPRISAELRQDLQQLPIIRTDRKSIWQYIGFKHVNGPAKWGSYAKAQYIAEVRKNFGISLEKIAEQIGDRNRTVQRLYRAMMVIRQAEDAKVFARENRFKQSFSFSHLYTGLDYDGFKRFLDLSDETSESDKPVPRPKLKHLGELCKWLYGDRRDKTRPLIESQNPDLAILDEVLMKDNAIDTLRNGLPLKVAHDVSRGDERIFRESLQEAKRVLQTALGTLTTGFKREDTDLVRTANQIAELVDDIVEQMERKRKPKRRHRMSEDDEDV